MFADSGDYKLVLIVRNDLKMGKGKAAAQVRFYKCLVYFDKKCFIKNRLKARKYKVFSLFMLTKKCFFISFKSNKP